MIDPSTNGYYHINKLKDKIYKKMAEEKEKWRSKKNWIQLN